MLSPPSSKILFFIIPFIFILFATFTGGFFYGHTVERNHSLQKTIKAFETRTHLDENTQNLDPFNLCRALGGSIEPCRKLMQDLKEAARTPTLDQKQ
ncbi:hypothetical protein [Bartonella sp. DGB2]|uniref:hypothetical protein n=1 Tax=Bartonella sp. DGB2 TaxID=3388426 RepID=UPI00399016B5